MSSCDLFWVGLGEMHESHVVAIRLLNSGKGREILFRAVGSPTRFTVTEQTPFVRSRFSGASPQPDEAVFAARSRR